MPTLTASERPPLPAGEYDAIVAQITSRTGERGEFLLWSFRLAVNGEDRYLHAASSTKFSPKSKTRAWVHALLGGRLGPGETIETDALVGKPCRVRVTQAELDDGRVVNRIDAVR